MYQCYRCDDNDTESAKTLARGITRDFIVRENALEQSRLTAHAAKHAKKSGSKAALHNALFCCLPPPISSLRLHPFLLATFLSPRPRLVTFAPASEITLPADLFKPIAPRSLPFLSSFPPNPTWPPNQRQRVNVITNPRLFHQLFIQKDFDSYHSS